jgi:hypothetical protein
MFIYLQLLYNWGYKNEIRTKTKFILNLNKIVWLVSEVKAIGQIG